MASKKPLSLLTRASHLVKRIITGKEFVGVDARGNQYFRYEKESILILFLPSTASPPLSSTSQIQRSTLDPFFPQVQ
jgi:hypothetical protein